MEEEREAVLEKVGDFVLDELFLEFDVDIALLLTSICLMMLSECWASMILARSSTDAKSR